MNIEEEDGLANGQQAVQRRQTSASPAPPLSPTCPIRPGVGGSEKDWWGPSSRIEKECQGGTVPANFAQVFEENFLQSLGERASGVEKFN